MITFSERTVRARKQHRCGMCGQGISAGDLYRVSVNLYDGRVYNWRECLPCGNDGICAWVYNWADYPDEGVGYEEADEWAGYVHWMRRPAERAAARRWLARAAGGEGE